MTLAEHRRRLETIDPNDLTAIDAWCEEADRLRRAETAGRQLVRRSAEPLPRLPLRLGDA